MTRATDTRWLSHQMVVDALRRSIKAVKLVMEQEAAARNVTALGLSLYLQKPTFIATMLVLSDVLSILGNLSRCFQSKSLNLLSVEDLVRDCKSALSELEEFPLQGGYARELDDVLVSMRTSEPLQPDSFISQIQSYIGNLIDNLEHCFPQLHLISLFGYLDPRNVHLATPTAINGLAEHFKLDEGKVWSEYLIFKSFVKNLHVPSGLTPTEAVTTAILGSLNCTTMSTLFPLISI